MSAASGPGSTAQPASGGESQPAAKRLKLAAAASADGGGGGDDGAIFWAVGEATPAGLQDGDPFLSTLVPRPTAWLVVQAPCEQEWGQAPVPLPEPLVALLEGYNASSDRPPTLMLAAEALPAEVWRRAYHATMHHRPPAGPC